MFVRKALRAGNNDLNVINTHYRTHCDTRRIVPRSVGGYALGRQRLINHPSTRSDN